MTYAAVRWLGYLAAFAVIGATVFRIWLVPRIIGATAEPVAAMSRRAVRAGRFAAVILALSILLRLYFQSRSMIEPDEPLSFDIVRLIIGSPWGIGWLAQGTAALGALIGWRAMARPIPARWVIWLVALSAIGLVLALPLTGHAIGLPAAGRLGYPVTVLHVGGGAIWLGTLGIILIAAIGPADPEFPLGPLVRAYSTIALPAGLVTIGAGFSRRMALRGWFRRAGRHGVWQCPARKDGGPGRDRRDRLVQLARRPAPAGNRPDRPIGAIRHVRNHRRDHPPGGDRRPRLPSGTERTRPVTVPTATSNACRLPPV